MIVTNASSANSAGGITENHRTIIAVSKHAIAEGSLAGGDEGISIDETADGGVVKTALQVIQTGFLVIDLAHHHFPGGRSRWAFAHRQLLGLFVGITGLLLISFWLGCVLANK